MKRISAILLALVLMCSIMAIPAFAAYDNVESLAIVGLGIPGAGDWNPADPAGDMTEVSDGIYEKVVTLTAGTEMKFKVAGNDAWDDTCNFGSANIVLGQVAELECGGGSGDMTFKADSDITIKITVNLTSDVATILVENSDGSTPAPKPPVDTPTDTPSDTPDGEMVTIHAYVPEGVSPKFWAWEFASQKNAFETWPGNPMSKDGKWWTIQVPTWCDGMIVNDGGDKKTADLKVEAGKEAWIVVQYDWTADVHYSEPDLKSEIQEAPPIDENPLFSRPTLGETTPTTTAGEGNTEQEADTGFSKKTQAIIIIITALLAVVAVAFVLSIPKKMK